ncbi:MAG: [FeFe] hydrogenase H-cluster maturation GTPase HydF [Bacteroidales bacterium]
METHRENKPHIAFYGRCNVGKSSLVNILTAQNVSIVSETRGTTTDTVKKTIELFNIGACVIIDTAGLDDVTPLGKERVKKTLESINLIDLAAIVISNNTFADYELSLIKDLKAKKIPYIIIYNKQDLYPITNTTIQQLEKYSKDFICVNTQDEKTREKITLAIQNNLNLTPHNDKGILNGIIKENDLVVLVTPIDLSAPKGRMILPQVKMIREILDNNAINMVVKPEQLEYTLANLKLEPKLVITDSQIFGFVSKIVPIQIALTSFSILLAKEKGAFEDYLKGTPKLDDLQDGDKILMLENCTHQPTCEDIGRVKLPNMIRKYSGKNLLFKAFAGLTDTNEKAENFALVVQCGGCVATQKQLLNRLQPFQQAGVPITNYGMAIAYMNGIFNRACEIFFK